MANVNIKFNNKDYLLSCDDGQEESLKKLTSYLDKYAATGIEYTKKIEVTIKKNSLSDFEDAELLSIGLRKGIKL